MLEGYRGGKAKPGSQSAALLVGIIGRIGKVSEAMEEYGNTVSSKMTCRDM